MSKPAAPRKQPRLQVFLDHGPVAASLLIGEDQILAPEPACLTVLAIGALGLLRKRRK